MKKEPIFEIYADSNRHYVRVYVDLNGKRMLLTDALRSVEAQFVHENSDQSEFRWLWPEHLYESIVDAEKGERRFIRPIHSNVLHFKMIEMEKQIILSCVLINWAKYYDGKGMVELTAEDGIIPEEFHTFPVYPDFIFDKAQFREELELLRPFYEENQRKEEEEHAEWERLCALNAEWDAETLKTVTIDYSTLVKPEHDGPIFKMYAKNNWVFAEIYVVLDGRRMSLLEVLKIWEKPFDEKIAGGYDWGDAGKLYESLVIDVRKGIPFHEILRCNGCGDWFCWSFRIEVRETDDLVIWTNFRQRSRNKYSPGDYWDYSLYPPLVFDKKQYYEELEQMRPVYENYLRWKEETGGS